MSSSASSKRSHTDFRILGLEIKQLDWSWFAPQALAADTKDAVLKKVEIVASEAPTAGAHGPAAAEDEAAHVELADAAQDHHGHDGDEADETDEKRSTAEDEQVNGQDQENDEENLDDVGQASNAEDDVDHDHDHDVDADADGDPDADADADVDADADGDSDADAEEDVAVSHADTDTVASELQHSVAATPEPSSSEQVVKTETDTQNGKASRAERTKSLANLRESTKLRLCFAAMSNAGPEGAPTGPKSDKIQEAKLETENGADGEGAIDQSVQAHQVDRETGENEAHREAVADDKDGSDSEAKQAAETTIDSGDVKDDEGPAQAADDDSAGVDVAAEVKEELPIKQEEETNEGESAKHVDDDSAAARTKKADPEPQAKGPPQLSLNRIFLSFAANRKRLAIDAEAVKSVRIHRSQHWIEICIDPCRQVDQTARKKGEGYLVCRGTLLETRAKGQENYTAVTRDDIASAWQAASSTEGEEHLELPPFFRLAELSTDLVLHVHLDPSAPLPEPMWLRNNSINELLAMLQRGSTAIAGQSETAVSVGTAQHVWAGKIDVLDPDPPPSMSTLLYAWVKESFIGSQRRGGGLWMTCLVARSCRK